MANVKISALPDANTPLGGTEQIPAVQSGVTTKTTAQDIANLYPINSLLAASTLTGSEPIAVYQGGANKKTTTQDIANLVSGGVTTTKISLNSSQILSLRSSPVTLITSPGSGKIINVMGVLTYMHFGGTPYNTHVDLILFLGNGVWQAATLTNILNANADELNVINYSSAVASVGNSANTALKVESGAGDPLGGNGTLDIYITYCIITL